MGAIGNPDKLQAAFLFLYIFFYFVRIGQLISGCHKAEMKCAHGFFVFFFFSILIKLGKLESNKLLLWKYARVFPK